MLTSITTAQLDSKSSRLLACTVAVALLANVTHAFGATLKETFQDHFLVGVAMNQRQFTEQDARGATIAKTQFNSITPENVLKWESVHPRKEQYNFEPADRYVEFGEKNGMVVIGHTLVWHSQTPRWVFQGDGTNALSREALLARMREHIHTVMGRYKGRIKGWDVANEALQDNGRMRESPWFKIIGEDYVAKAFEYAHEADPAAELYYNDYSLEMESKRKACIELVKKLQAQGIRVAGIGTQHHNKLKSPTIEEVEKTIVEFGKLGVKVMITELDVDVVRATQRNLSADVADVARANRGGSTNGNALPDSIQQELAQRYAQLFSMYVKHSDVIDRVTLWGVTDGDSWLNAPGRVNHPLLFDRQGQPKPAFDAVIKTGGKPICPDPSRNSTPHRNETHLRTHPPSRWNDYGYLAIELCDASKRAVATIAQTGVQKFFLDGRGDQREPILRQRPTRASDHSATVQFDLTGERLKVGIRSSRTQSLHL
jgi:endo-1,4-beta-xylanase